MGIAATHVLVVAKLKIKGQDFGPHAFLVPIRDPKTHEPFSGIDVGDIGPKMGLNSLDNGYLRFDNYRVAKDCMLTRFAKINDSDEYEVLDPNAIKILYLSLIRARSTLIFDSFFPISLSLIISLRYSLIREQFPDPENPSKEKKILDYQIQRFKLFRILARLYSLVFTISSVRRIYTEEEKKSEAGDGSNLAYLHCIISLYKGFVTNTTLECIEEARRSCGGHGFMMLAGISSIYLNYLPSITFDGDNSILILQAARYLVSLVKKNNKAEIPENLQYLLAADISLDHDYNSFNFHQACFETAARNRMQRLVKKETFLLSKGGKKEVVWNNDLQIDAINACEAVYYASIHKYFIAGIQRISDIKVKQVLETLRQIFATSEIERFYGELARVGVNENAFNELKRLQLEAFDKIRPDALGLVEVFEFGDEVLNTVIGPRDGKIYKNMFDTAKNLNPLNKDRVFPGIKKYLKPKL